MREGGDWGTGDWEVEEKYPSRQDFQLSVEYMQIFISIND